MLEELEARVQARTRDLATERDRLQAAVEDLRNLTKLKGAFVNAVSHDLRIPLTGIMGYAEFLEEGIGGELNEQQAEFARQILEASKRMTGLLNDLLDYARMEAGKFHVEPRPVPLRPVIDQALSTFRPALEKKRLTLSVEVPAGLGEVLADPDRVVQVLSNLLSNAAKFTPEGGAIAVRVRPRPDDQALEVAVADTGPGISEADQAHLFERFFQTEEGRKAGGTGLGLSISKTLVEAQNGAIGVESRLGEGSTFWFTLPLAEQAEIS